MDQQKGHEPTDRLAQIAAEWRAYCAKLPGYKPHTAEEMDGIVIRWRQDAQQKLKESRLRPTKRRKRRDSGDQEGNWGT